MEFHVLRRKSRASRLHSFELFAVMIFEIVLCLLRGVSVVFLWCEVVVVPCVFMGGPGFSL